MSDLTASERKALKEMIKRELEARRKTMKRAIKTKPKRGAARDLFAELREGMEALTDARQGKRTLRTHAMEFRPAPKITPQELIRLRRSLKLSRALFAVYLRTNVRTLENWEQGRAKPNAQAALLINLVKRYPDTVERLAAL
jgi:putative transcriptional regulator